MKANLNSLNEVMQKPDVEKILEDLSNLPEFQMPKNRRQRRLLKQQGYLTDAAEVYSPPGVTATASKMGLKAAWALDLTHADPENGKPGDFSDERKQAKARGKLDKDKPLMLVVCVRCAKTSAPSRTGTMPRWIQTMSTASSRPR